MKPNTKRLLAVGAVVLAVGGGAGAALASSAPSTASQAHGLFHFRHPRVVRLVVKSASDYLGLTPQQLREQLRAGKSLAEIATAQGKTVDGLKSAILGAVKTRLDQVVAANRITSAREQALLDGLSTRLDTLLYRHFGHTNA
jgi:phage tail protein X